MKRIIIGDYILPVSESDYRKLERICIFDKTDKERINSVLDDMISKYEYDSILADHVFHYIREV